MLDSYGRNIDYLRISITDRCNLRCIYCMPSDGIEKMDHEDIIRFEEIIKITRAAASFGIKKVRFTGGEPLIIKGIDKLIYETSRISSISDIAITTNGILLHDMLDDLKNAGLKRVNISLDSLDSEKFKLITRGGDIRKVTSAIESSISKGLTPVKINIVVIKGINDNEIDDFINLTKDMPVHIRFIELMPIGEGVKYFNEGLLRSEEIINEHPELERTGDKKGGVAEIYRLKNALGTVGFITPLSCKFCDNCNRIRLTSVGTIKPCLHSESEIPVKQYINNEILLEHALRDAIMNKPLEHKLETDKKSKSRKMMFQIGG